MLNDVISGQWTWCSSASDPQKFDDIYIKINYFYQSQNVEWLKYDPYWLFHGTSVNADSLYTFIYEYCECIEDM